MLEYTATAARIDGHHSSAKAKQATVLLDTDPAGQVDALNPAELLLASLSACMLKAAERAVPLLDFKHDGIEIKLRGLRQDSPPKMISIDYDIIVDTEETQHRLDLLHTNIRKYGTISNTLAGVLTLQGTISARS